MLAALDGVRPAEPNGPVWTALRYLAVAPIAVAAALGLGFGSAFGLYSWHQLQDAGADVATAQDNAYLAGRALAIGASAAVVLLLLILLRHDDIGASASDG